MSQTHEVARDREFAPPAGRRLSSGALLVAIVLVCVAVPFFVARARTGGTFVYPLDDSYIHLALAKNIAENGIYGITSHEFTPASSSIVWPLLLAALRLVYKGELGPLLLNVVFGALLALVIDRGLRRDGYDAKGRVFVGGAMLLVTPIASNVLIGMEHTLHILATLVLVHAAVDALAAPAGRRDLLVVALAAMLAASARYETVFVVGVLGLLALFRRRLGLAFALGIGAAIPVAALAAFSMAHGEAALPYPVLLKRHHFVATTFVRELTRPYFEQPELFILLVLMAFAYAARRERARWERGKLRLVIAAATIVLHASFAKSGWLFRYESYAVSLSLAALAGPLWEARSTLRTYALPFALLALPVALRGTRSLITTPKASYNIYEQQLQMARFVAQYYPDQPIVIQDVGAISYFSDPRVVDLIGLGSPAVARLKLVGAFHGAAVDAVAQGNKIAIVYDKMARPPWKKVGSWVISDNVVCEESRVSFYAIDPGEDARLVASLREFAPLLPATVEQSGMYLR